MSDGYTNTDLDAAEQAYIAAGHPEQARAARQLTEGWRNMMMGAYGQSLMQAFDKIVGGHIQPLSEQIGGLKVDLQAEFRTGLQGVQATVSDLAETLNDHEIRMAAHDTQIAALQATQADHAQQLAAHDTAIKLLSEWRARLDEWRKQLTP
jgi:hypothetical protein